jgi:cadmium resistance protein CadD (predicted permease)
MKTKRIIYFLLIITGALIMGVGETYMEKEYALSIGIVLLMFGIYKSTQIWSDGNDGEATNEKDR